ncbi:uncharacterized protein K02A2.6-like [Drosophila willistoni]|uniref:uncharacterized protein K02A2.6-like n=1 Tax=Drosophila willistoni TaxID=7260 RepID=UPI001F086F0C|nr:uncharacterized protein K02A2.6-like [Drosophila willistoni]
MGKSWIYHMKKEDLLQTGQRIGVSMNGTAEKMRKQLGEWVDNNESDPEWKEEISRLDDKFTKMFKPKPGTSAAQTGENGEHKEAEAFHKMNMATLTIPAFVPPRWGSKLNIVADALSRQPMEICNRITDNGARLRQANKEFGWIQDMMKKIKQQPQKYTEYVVENSQLYRNVIEVVAWKMCVPKSLRHQIMKENHTSAAGHTGNRRTIARTYYWPGMQRDIRIFVGKCMTCPQFKPNQQQAAIKLLTKVPEEPWATICADFVGPLPRSKHGNSMLLVIMDRFSKWTEIIPMRKAPAENSVKAFRKRILSRFGTPKVVISHNGVQFKSRIFKKVLEGWGSSHQLTAPYTPQENQT